MPSTSRSGDHAEKGDATTAEHDLAIKQISRSGNAEGDSLQTANDNDPWCLQEASGSEPCKIAD